MFRLTQEKLNILSKNAQRFGSTLPIYKIQAPRLRNIVHIFDILRLTISSAGCIILSVGGDFSDFTFSIRGFISMIPL